MWPHGVPPYSHRCRTDDFAWITLVERFETLQERIGIIAQAEQRHAAENPRDAKHVLVLRAEPGQRREMLAAADIREALVFRKRKAEKIQHQLKGSQQFASEKPACPEPLDIFGCQD